MRQPLFWVKGEHACDLAGSHFFSGLCAIGVDSQPEGAEVAEFDDVAFGFDIDFANPPKFRQEFGQE